MLFCMCAFVGAKSRRDVRVKFNLVAEPFSDCLTYFLYPFCTVCQEAYELRARGFGSQFGPPGGMGGMMMGSDGWDEDARAMNGAFKMDESRSAMETIRACLQSSYDMAEIYSPQGGERG